MNKNSSITNFLLKEANNRLSKFKKQAMGLYSGQGDVLNSNNTSYERIPMGEDSRIARIKSAIEESFGNYLRSRLIDPVTHKKSTRLTTMSPGVGEQLSNRQSFPILDENILAIDKPGDFEYDAEFQPGHLYFRYGYSRDMLPLRNPEHMQRASGLLSHFHQLSDIHIPPTKGNRCPSCASPVESNMCSICGNDKKKPQDVGVVNFAGIIRRSNIALLAYFNTRNAGNDPSAIPPSLARQFISNIKQAQPIRVQSAYGKQKELFGNIDLRLVRYIEKEEEKEIPYTVGKTGAKKVLTFKNDFIDLNDNLEKPSELNRQLFWKICSGYTLNEQLLDKIIAQYIDDYMKHFPSGKDNNFLKRQQLEWQHAKRIMLKVFITMEKRAPVEFKRAMASWYGATEKVQPTEDYAQEDNPPTEGLNYQHGMPFYGSSKLLRCYTTEQGGEICINFRSIHLKMLLISCVTPKPENYQKCTATKSGLRREKIIRPDTFFPLPLPDEYIEPRYTVKSIPDGMSDAINSRMAKAGLKEMGVPPLIKVPITNGFEARLDRHNCNLGRKHLAKSGLAVLNLLEWAEQTDWPRKAINQLNEAFQSGKMHDESAEVYRVLSEGTFGSDVFQYYMDMYGSNPDMFYDQHIRRGLRETEEREYGTEVETEFPVNEKTLALLRKHGPAISALMDLTYALMHRASISSVKIQDSDDESRSMVTYGQQYDGTSGAGGGGEVMMSIKFSYEAKLEQLGSDEAVNRWKEEIPGHDPQIRKRDVLFRQTDPSNLGQAETRQELDEGAIPDMVRPHILQHLTFWVGQSSTTRTPGRQGGQRLPRMTTLWPKQGFQGKTWAEALDYFYLRYPQIAEDTGEVIFDIGINLGALEKRLSDSFEKVKRELELENPIAITTEFGTYEVNYPIAARERKPETVTPQQKVVPTQPVVPQGPVQTTQQEENPEVNVLNQPNQPTVLPKNKNQPKPMEQIPSNYIGKRKDKRVLIKSKNRLRAESLVDRIYKVATNCDLKGEKELADIWDKLLSKII